MNNNLDELYKVYGSLLIQVEIIQGKINECKRQIVNELNKPGTPTVDNSEVSKVKDK